MRDESFYIYSYKLNPTDRLVEEFDVSSQNPFTKIGGQLGSNEGGKYEHKLTKEHHYIKFPKNEEQARVEVATSQIYNLMGIKTLNPKIMNLDNRVAVVTKWRDDFKKIPSREFESHIETKEHTKQLANIYNAAVLTKNHDVVGLEKDNIMKHGEDFVSVDQGGSMNYRAMGEKKDFKPDVEELVSLRNSKRTSGQVFNKVFDMHPEAGKEVAHNLHNLTDDKVDSIISSNGLDSGFSDVIKARRDLLKKHYGI